MYLAGVVPFKYSYNHYIRLNDSNEDFEQDPDSFLTGYSTGDDRQVIDLKSSCKQTFSI